MQITCLENLTKNNVVNDTGSLHNFIFINILIILGGCLQKCETSCYAENVILVNSNVLEKQDPSTIPSFT